MTKEISKNNLIIKKKMSFSKYKKIQKFAKIKIPKKCINMYVKLNLIHAFNWLRTECQKFQTHSGCQQIAKKLWTKHWFFLEFSSKFPKNG